MFAWTGVFARITVSKVVFSRVTTEGVDVTVINAEPVTTPETKGDDPGTVNRPFLIEKVTLGEPSVPSVATHQVIR